MGQVIVIQDDFDTAERFDKGAEGSGVLTLEVYDAKGEVIQRRKLYASPKTMEGLLKGKGEVITRKPKAAK